MQPSFRFKTTQEDFLAHITDAAYGVLLREGLQRSFVDVEMELWQKLRNIIRSEVLPREPSSRSRWSTEHLPSELCLIETA